MYNDSKYIGQTDELFGLGKRAQARRDLKADAKANYINAKADALRATATADAAMAAAVAAPTQEAASSVAACLSASSGPNWAVIGGVGFGVIVIAVVLFFVFKK